MAVTEKARPYDPKDGCPLGRTDDKLDANERLPSQMPGHGDGGFLLQFINGVFGYHTALDPALNDLPAAPDSDLVVYAPTVLPAGASCIESTTIRWRVQGQSYQTNQQGFWDHCNTHYWYYLQNFLSVGWASKYIRTGYGDNYPHLVTQVWETDTTNKCWQALILNYNTGYYDVVTQNVGTGSVSTICGTGTAGQNGWTAWESYGLVQTPSCPTTIHGVGHFYLQQYTPATGWYGLVLNPAGGAFGAYDCWVNGTYTMKLLYPFTNDGWGSQTTAAWTGW